MTKSMAVATKISSLERTLFDLLLALVAIILVLQYTRCEPEAPAPDSPATTLSDAESPDYETDATDLISFDEEECAGRQRPRGCGREWCRDCYADVREYAYRCHVEPDYDEYLEEMQDHDDEDNMDWACYANCFGD